MPETPPPATSSPTASPDDQELDQAAGTVALPISDPDGIASGTIHFPAHLLTARQAAAGHREPPRTAAGADSPDPTPEQRAAFWQGVKDGKHAVEAARAADAISSTQPASKSDSNEDTHG